MFRRKNVGEVGAEESLYQWCQIGWVGEWLLLQEMSKVLQKALLDFYYYGIKAFSCYAKESKNLVPQDDYQHSLQLGEGKMTHPPLTLLQTAR